jgi:RHS repeat-associated protein
MALLERAPNIGPAESYWYHYDGLGSVVALTDEAGLDACALRYDEYGNLLRGCNEINHYSYTGQEYDPETGLYHFFARYYDPEVGVWITLDEHRGNTENPVTLHRVMYVLGNPILLVDSYGFISDLPDFSTMWNVYKDNINSVDPTEDNYITNVVGHEWIRNSGGTCTLRMSYVLNYSGEEIPFIPQKAEDPDNVGTVSGDDDKNYMYDVPTFKKYMTQTYGEPEILPQQALNARQGIIIFVYESQTNPATRYFHTDLYDGNTNECVNHCYFGNGDVLFWESPSEEVPSDTGLLSALIDADKFGLEWFRGLFGK